MAARSSFRMQARQRQARRLFTARLARNLEFNRKLRSARHAPAAYSDAMTFPAASASASASTSAASAAPTAPPTTADPRWTALRAREA